MNGDDISPNDEELSQYQADPCPRTLNPLMNRGQERLRKVLIGAFRETPHWKIAQHLALAWSNKLGSGVSPPDFTRAAYFAHVACQRSDEHPWARFVRASIYWERRLSYLVLDDADKAAASTSRLDDPSQAEFFLTQLDSLRVCALAYEGRVLEAIDLCEALWSTPFGPTDEALLQCFISTRPSEPELHHRAAMLAARRSNIFGKRPMGMLTRAVQVALLRAISQKGSGDV